MANKAPSFTRIVRTDYFASLSFWFPFMGWAVVGVLLLVLQSQGYLDPECCDEGYQPESVILILLFAAITFTLLAWLALLWRCQMLQSTFQDGAKVSGIVSNAILYGDRLRLEYNYMHQGRKYTTSNVVYKSQRTESLRIGSKIIVTLNPERPKHAFIYEVYLTGHSSTVDAEEQETLIADGPSSQSQEALHESIPEMEFHGQYNKKLYYKTFILAALPSKRATAIRLLMFTGFVILGFNLITVSMPIQGLLNILSLFFAVFLIAMVGYVLGLPYILSWRAATITWQEAKNQAPFEGRVTEQGITTHTSFSDECFKWEEFATVRKFQDVLTLVTDDARLSGHSPVFFKSTEDWERFQQIVAQKVIEAK